MEALDEVRSIIGDHNAMAGSAVAIATATESTVSQIPVIAAFAILFAFLVLILTTTSYVEPAVILAGLGLPSSSTAEVICCLEKYPLLPMLPEAYYSWRSLWTTRCSCCTALLNTAKKSPIRRQQWCRRSQARRPLSCPAE